MSELERNLIQRMNVGDTLSRSADRFADGVALVEGSRSVTYSEFNALANRIAHSLIERGYEVGDAVALMSGNSIEFLAVYFACSKAGVIVVPINLNWRPNEIAYVLNHAQVKGIFVEGHLIEELNVALQEYGQVGEVIILPWGVADAGGDATAATVPSWIHFERYLSDDTTEPLCQVDDRAPLSYLYTSGTTSAPKGVVSSNLSVYVESLGVGLDLSFSNRDRIATMLPMFHTAQLNAFCTPAVLVGATLYIMRGFDANALLTSIDADRLTIIFGLPMMYRAMLENSLIDQIDLSSLRLAVYAMAPMPEALLESCIARFDCDFCLLFGQTEMAPVTTIFRPEHQLTHKSAAGTPGVNTMVAILDSEGQRVPQGESGEIAYRSPQVMTEYLRDDAATEEAFRGGWFHSGDIGHLGKDGVLWFEDRSKDVIKTGGENVASLEVERAIYRASSEVAEVVVVGLPHQRWSEAITAFVVRTPESALDAETLLESLRELIDPYKIPKSVIFVDELPHTSTGKVQKNVVRNEFRTHFQSS